MKQTFFWVRLAMAFFVFMWIEEGQKPALEYISAYLMEWSLSIDNIFVFILIFNAFGVKEKYYSRVLIDRYYDGHRFQNTFYYNWCCCGTTI